MPLTMYLGQANLPPSCPVCEHSPLSAEDCKPHKSLRITIRVFLRTEEKKRGASRAKEEKASEPPTPIEAPKPSLPPVEPPAPEVKAEERIDSNAPEDIAPTAATEDHPPVPEQLANEVRYFSRSRMNEKLIIE